MGVSVLTQTFEFFEILIGKKAFIDFFVVKPQDFRKLRGEPPTSHLSPYLRVKSSKKVVNIGKHFCCVYVCRGGELNTDLGGFCGVYEFFLKKGA